MFLKRKVQSRYDRTTHVACFSKECATHDELHDSSRNVQHGMSYKIDLIKDKLVIWLDIANHMAKNHV
jgi:hypothetical protein